MPSIWVLIVSRMYNEISNSTSLIYLLLSMQLSATIHALNTSPYLYSDYTETFLISWRIDKIFAYIFTLYTEFVFVVVTFFQQLKMKALLVSTPREIFTQTSVIKL